MPRLARLDIPGLLQHVIIRGIERRDIFKDDIDRQNYLDRVTTLPPETGVRCYAWASLSNPFSPVIDADRSTACVFHAPTFDRICGDVQSPAQPLWAPVSEPL